MTEVVTEPAGLFISFEGTEGSGKTTQLRLLEERLIRLGCNVVRNQEPGGSPIGSAIRRVLLDPANSEMASQTELLLMFASRTQAAAEIVRPALMRGDIVLSDRWTDSSLAYQGAARGLGFENVLALHQLALGNLFPDLTICISIDVETGLKRATHRNRRSGTSEQEARIDLQSLDFHLRVRDGYARIAAAEPNRFKIVDGSGSPDIVFERVWTEVSPLVKQAQWTTVG